MPTRKITRALRRPRAPESRQAQVVTEYASLVDLLAIIQRRNVSILPISSHKGQEILGRGLAGSIQQSIADAKTGFAFKEGIPSKQPHDTDQDQDWYSLATELTILQHAPIRSYSCFVNLVGVCFHVDVGAGSQRFAWPLLVTAKVDVGDLSTLLRNEGHDLLTTASRLQIFAQIFEAVSVLHICGAAHGDLKPDNFLISTLDDKGLQCALIDFGSSVIRGQTRVPTTDEPWSAPELTGHVESLGYDELAQTDLFSCGLTMIHVLVPIRDLRRKGLCFVRQVDQNDAEWGSIISKVRGMKALDGGVSLSTAFKEAVKDATIGDVERSLLCVIISSMIAPGPGKRSMSRDALMENLALAMPTSRFDFGDLDPVLPPPLASNTVALDHSGHSIFDLALSLGQLDDTDYVVRANIVSDLKHKARESSCSACRKDYAFQVTVSQTTGFEGELEESTLQTWLNESGRDRAHLDSEIERVSSSYQDPGRVASDVLSVLGIGVLLSAERSDEYQLSGRLRESEHHLVSEIKMRVRAFGEGHWCLARLLSELAQVLMASSQWDEAEACQQRAALALEKKFGQRNPKPLLANVVLADIMAERGRIFEGVKPLKALRPLLEDVLGPEHPETITALQILARMLSVACQFQEAAEICHRVVDLRSKQLAPAHPMTIRAQLTYITVLGAQGRLEEASNIMHDVELKLQSFLASDAYTSASLNIIRAGLYRELGDLDVALATINAALDTMNGLGLDTDNRLRLDGLEVLASIYGQRLDTADEERVLRQVLDIRMQNLEQEGKLTRELSAARTKLASNLVRQRKLDEASVIANRVLESGVHSILDDPNAFASCVSIQADVLVHRRQFDEAQKLLENLLESCRSELGENHVLTLDTLCSLGHVSDVEGKYDQAQAYYESSLRQIRETGEVGRGAIKSITGLAVALREGGQLARAKELCLEGIDWASKTVGETNILILKLYKALGLCLIDLGELSEAERIYGTKLKEQSRGTAIEVSVKECMAWLKREQGHIAESTALLVEVCHSLESESGKEHPDAVKMKANVLHNLLSEEQVPQVTVEEALENIQLKEQIFGADDPSTITSMANLAYACARTRRIDLSNQLYQRLLAQDGNIAKIGPLNRAALLGKVAFHYFINDDLVKAEELERKIVSIRQSVFGRDHVSILRGLANLASTLQRQGKNQDAEGILREIRTGYTGKITEDPQVIFSFFKASISLGAVLYLQKTPEKLPECVQLYLETIQQAQGLGFPSTIVDVWKADLEAVLQEMSAAG